MTVVASAFRASGFVCLLSVVASAVVRLSGVRWLWLAVFGCWWCWWWVLCLDVCGWRCFGAVLLWLFLLCWLAVGGASVLLSVLLAVVSDFYSGSEKRK